MNQYKTMMLLGLLFANILLSQKLTAVKSLDVKDFPKAIPYKAKVKKALSWTDGLGKNLAIWTETGIYSNPKFKHENNGADAALLAYHFIFDKKNAVETWRIYDYVADCPVDIEASFMPNACQVTDLNQDGVAEIWSMYKTVCHGDVSPCTMKIIMYQGAKKYSMRGENRVELSKNEFYGGSYQFDKAFVDGPKVFLDFAKKLWQKNLMQKS
jgi:hypothetical protein